MEARQDVREAVETELDAQGQALCPTKGPLCLPPAESEVEPAEPLPPSSPPRQPAAASRPQPVQMVTLELEELEEINQEQERQMREQMEQGLIPTLPDTCKSTFHLPPDWLEDDPKQEKPFELFHNPRIRPGRLWHHGDTDVEEQADYESPTPYDNDRLSPAETEDFDEMIKDGLEEVQEERIRQQRELEKQLGYPSPPSSPKEKIPPSTKRMKKKMHKLEREQARTRKQEDARIKLDQRAAYRRREEQARKRWAEEDAARLERLRVQREEREERRRQVEQTTNPPMARSVTLSCSKVGPTKKLDDEQRRNLDAYERAKIQIQYRHQQEMLVRKRAAERQDLDDYVSSDEDPVDASYREEQEQEEPPATEPNADETTASTPPEDRLEAQMQAAVTAAMDPTTTKTAAVTGEKIPKSKKRYHEPPPSRPSYVPLQSREWRRFTRRHKRNRKVIPIPNADAPRKESLKEELERLRRRTDTPVLYCQRKPTRTLARICCRWTQKEMKQTPHTEEEFFNFLPDYHIVYPEEYEGWGRLTDIHGQPTDKYEVLKPWKWNIYFHGPVIKDALCGEDFCVLMEIEARKRTYDYEVGKQYLRKLPASKPATVTITNTGNPQLDFQFAVKTGPPQPAWVERLNNNWDWHEDPEEAAKFRRELQDPWKTAHEIRRYQEYGDEVDWTVGSRRQACEDEKFRMLQKEWILSQERKEASEELTRMLLHPDQQPTTSTNRDPAHMRTEPEDPSHMTMEVDYATAASLVPSLASSQVTILEPKTTAEHKKYRITVRVTPEQRKAYEEAQAVESMRKDMARSMMSRSLPKYPYPDPFTTKNPWKNLPRLTTDLKTPTVSSQVSVARSKEPSSSSQGIAFGRGRSDKVFVPKPFPSPPGKRRKRKPLRRPRQTEFVHVLLRRVERGSLRGHQDHGLLRWRRNRWQEFEEAREGEEEKIKIAFPTFTSVILQRHTNLQEYIELGGRTTWRGTGR